MGLFDFLEDLVDEATEVPGKVAKLGIKTVASVPKTVKKTCEDIEDAIEEVIEESDIF